MNRNELRERFRGVVGVTVTPVDENYQINYGRMADLTRWWVENGLVRGSAMLKVGSVMGEGPQMQDYEWPALVRAVVQAANDKIDVIASTHCKDTMRTIEDCKKAQDMGAIGLQIAPPMFNDPNQDDILRFYESVSNAIEVGIMVYQNHWFRYSGITADTFRKMVNFEKVVAIKWNGYEDCPDETMKELSQHFNMIENGNDRIGFHKNGGSGFLDKSAIAYPPYELKMWNLLESGNYIDAQNLWDTVDVPLKNLGAKIGARSGGQARMKKAIMNAMGHNVGNQRPPSLPPTAQEMGELSDLLRSFGWPVPA